MNGIEIERERGCRSVERKVIIDSQLVFIFYGFFFFAFELINNNWVVWVCDVCWELRMK